MHSNTYFCITFFGDTGSATRLDKKKDTPQERVRTYHHCKPRNEPHMNRGERNATQEQTKNKPTANQQQAKHRPGTNQDTLLKRGKLSHLSNSERGNEFCKESVSLCVRERVRVKMSERDKSMCVRAKE